MRIWKKFVVSLRFLTRGSFDLLRLTIWGVVHVIAKFASLTLTLLLLFYLILANLFQVIIRVLLLVVTVVAILIPSLLMFCLVGKFILNINYIPPIILTGNIVALLTATGILNFFLKTIIQIVSKSLVQISKYLSHNYILIFDKRTLPGLDTKKNRCPMLGEGHSFQHSEISERCLFLRFNSSLFQF